MKLILASNNKKKIAEVKAILEPFGYEVISQSEAGFNFEAEETGVTFEENAAIKAREIYALNKCAVISDDSGLEVKALNGAPGVYSARYGGEGLTDVQRYELLLENMKDVKEEDREANFTSVIHFIYENGEEFSVRGECFGKIGYEPKGENGFGYDPVFYVGEKSFAELTAEEKNKISHRGRALEKLREKLSENIK